MRSTITSPYNDFSTWQGFGKLWEWAIKQEWWQSFGDTVVYADHVDFDVTICNLEHFIHPDRFADAVYAFLKESA